MTLPAPSGPFGPNRGTDTGLWRTGELEDELIATLDLPLNLQGNPLNLFHPVLAGVRAECAAQAKALPVVPNPGTGGRRQARTSVHLQLAAGSQPERILLTPALHHRGRNRLILGMPRLARRGRGPRSAG
jgi:hypothetical protein